MSANSERIAMSVRLETSVYQDMHTFAEEVGATHNAVIEHALKFYLSHISIVVRHPTPKAIKSAIQINPQRA